MQYAPLPERALLRLTGEDSVDFLQGLITNDAARLRGGQPVYAALLSAQGKFLHDFFLFPWQGDILLDGEKARLPDLMQRLNLYKLRAKVQIALLPESVTVVVAWGDRQFAFPPAFAGGADPRLPELGWRMAGDMAALSAHCGQQGLQRADAQAYDRMRLELGVPDGGRDLIVDKSILLEAGFEALHGVDFAKGCYVGQEVTARSKHRGQVKKALYQVRAHGTLPPSGTAVTLNGTAIGSLRSHAGSVGLALLAHEAVEQAKTGNAALLADTVPLSAALPPWCNMPQ